MSLQRLAVISAVSSHGMLRNRTYYYERQLNQTDLYEMNFQRDVNIVGCIFIFFVIVAVVCLMYCCFNRSINKSSMAYYRRHLMEAANNQNMDIYTVEQFYETETYAPLCDTQSAQGVLPPSYENVMAAEKAILEKYAKICTSTTCCEHSNLNRSNLEPSNNNDSNISEDAHTIHDSEMDKDDDEENVLDESMYDVNGNKLIMPQASHHCCGNLDANVSSACCRMNNECICINNCPIRCDTNRTTNPDAKDDENNNMVFDNSDENANISELQQMNASRTESMECQCNHRQNADQKESLIELNALSDNGIIRMDMSKIIDRTGLPTYEAAIKLESFGYV